MPRKHKHAKPPLIEAGADDKQIVFVRHAESLAQTVPQRHRAVDGALLDSDLSAAGLAQLAAMQSELGGVAPDLVVSSPLTRALRTALALFPTAAPVIAHPGLAEVNSFETIPENVGRPWKRLMQDASLSGLERVDASLVEASSWPHRLTAEGRPSSTAADAVAFLLVRPERRIVLVGHCNWAQDNIPGVGYVRNLDPIHLVLRAGEFHLSSGKHDWFAT